MMRLVRELRLIPVVLLATICLLGLKVLGLVLHGGYTLADLDFGSSPSQVAANSRAAKSSWAREMFSFPDVTGAVDSDKKAEKPAEKAAEPKPGAAPSVKPPESRPAEAKPAEAKPGAKPAEAKPPDAKSSNGGTVIQLEGNGGSSPAERAILERLGERRQELDARARELEIRENLLKSAEKRLDGRASELKGMESELGVGDQKKAENEAVRLKGLVTMYENMKPKDAAKIFDRLEMSVLIAVVSQINPRKMSDIMAQMQPDNAERLTVALAGRATMGAAAPAAAELPQIEGHAPGPPPAK
jgi:flagellar motility protein MotE (MotC chaperone)